MTDVTVRVEAHAQVGEGAIWDSTKEVLYWIDILGGKLYIYNPVSGKNQTYEVGQHVGTVVPKNANEVMLAVYDGFASFNLETQALTLISDPEADKPNNRFNDGKCDPAGRFWAGTMAYEDHDTQGALYCMDTDYSVRKMMGGLGIANGIIWSLDHSTMYYIDSIRYNVRAYDYDIDSGNISNERVIIEVPDEVGLPDGMTIDAEGMLWVAHFGGSRVCRWHPGTGKILTTIPLPASKITSCAFGDKELDTLYITSASFKSSDDDPVEAQAGNLFSVKPGVRGVKSFGFGG